MTAFIVMGSPTAETGCPRPDRSRHKRVPPEWYVICKTWVHPTRSGGTYNGTEKIARTVQGLYGLWATARWCRSLPFGAAEIVRPSVFTPGCSPGQFPI